MDYATLIADKDTPGSIKSWVNYSKPPVADIVLDTEAYIYQRLRVREMMFTSTVTISSGASTATLPTRWLDPIAVYLRDPFYPLAHKTIGFILGARVYDESVLIEGIPNYYAVSDGTFQFDVKAEEALTLDVAYFASLVPLSTSSTNFLTTRYPLLVRQACVAFAAWYMKDYEEMKNGLAIVDGMIDDIKSSDDLSSRGVDHIE